MVPPSRIATATSRIRPPFRARTPVVSTSTTAKRECSRDWDGGLEVIPAERQGHAPGTAAAADQLAPIHRDHGAITVIQPLLSRQQVHGRHRPEPGMLELPQNTGSSGWSTACMAAKKLGISLTPLDFLRRCSTASRSGPTKCGG